MDRLWTLLFAGVVAASAGSAWAQQPTQQPTAPEKPSAPVETPSAVRNSGAASATTNVNSADVKTGHAVARVADLPAVVPAGRRVVGLALEGGGALGLAHIGVLRWMEEHRIPIDRMAGTSMGALVGGLYATGKSTAQLEQIATGSELTSIFSVETPYTDLNYRRREDRRQLPQSINIGLKGGPSLRNALVSDSGLNALLREQMFAYDTQQLSFDKLPIPFRCVSTDLNTVERVVFDGGPMPEALRASISIPGIFPPAQAHGHYLVDGAIVDNLPTDIVRQDLHADVVIGVHLVGPAFAASDVSSIVGVFARAYAAGTARTEEIGKAGADVLIQTETASFGVSDYDKAPQLIAAGYAAAEKMAEQLQPLALNEADWQQYLADRASRVRSAPGALELVAVRGGSAGAQQQVRRVLAPLQHKPMQAEQVDAALRRVQGNGTVQSSFVTFSSDRLAPKSSMAGASPDNGVEVHLTPVPNGPPFLLFGADLTASTSNVTRTTFDTRLLNSDLGGYGSELRTDVRLGFLTQASTEYYRLLRPSGYFVEPRAGVLRQPVYLWRDQQRISEHLLQQAGGGVEAGRTFSRNLQASVRYDVQTLRWHPVSGGDGTLPVSGTAQTAVAHLAYDTTQSGLFSPTGIRLDVLAGGLFRTVQSAGAPLFGVRSSKTFAVRDDDVLLLSFDANSYLRRRVTEPLRFTVGGPLRLSASSVDEFRGTDTYLARAGYVRRIATLPSGYGHGLYGTLTYEAAEVWAPERRAVLRQDGVLSLIGVTPIGALTVGGSVGDAGHRKFFLTFGRLF